MSAISTRPILREIVKQMMKERNIDDYQFSIDGGTGNSDGYIGEILFFHVIINGKERLNLVLKSAKAHEGLRIRLSSDILYDREFDMYTKVIPVLEEFAKSKKFTELSTFIPKLWFAEKHLDQVNIVLENLKVQKFQLCDRKTPMDVAHMRLLFETYGKWHGVTMAFKDQHPEMLAKLVENWSNPRLKLLQTFDLVRHHTEEFSVVKNMLNERKRYDIVKIFEGFEDQIESIMFRQNLDQEDMLVISHGDNWSNNYMFKYQNNGKISTPTEVFLLDFQLAKPDSPALELSSTLYNMGDKHTFEDFDNLLSIYHKSLSKTLKSLGSNPGELFTMKDLKRHWKKHSLCSILYVFTYIRIALCEADEAPDLHKLAEENAAFEDAFSFEIKDMEVFWERAMDIFVHYGEFCISNVDLQ